MQSQERMLRRAAHQAGVALYGDDLVWGSSKVRIRKISDRIKEGFENDTDPCCIGLVDDYEYSFTVDGEGIEASGDAITDPRFMRRGWVCLYDPEFGLDCLWYDMTTEEMYKTIRRGVI